MCIGVSSGGFCTELPLEVSLCRATAQQRNRICWTSRLSSSPDRGATWAASSQPRCGTGTPSVVSTSVEATARSLPISAVTTSHGRAGSGVPNPCCILPGAPLPTTPWADAQRGNIVATGNVLRASREHGVRRVIFASSNQIMAGYRFADVLVTTEMPPAPLNPYAVSKLFCEEAGRAFAAETGISFIALRIGNILPRKTCLIQEWESASGASRCGCPIAISWMVCRQPSMCPEFPLRC